MASVIRKISAAVTIIKLAQVCACSVGGSSSEKLDDPIEYRCESVLTHSLLWSCLSTGSGASLATCEHMTGDDAIKRDECFCVNNKLLQLAMSVDGMSYDYRNDFCPGNFVYQSRNDKDLWKMIYEGMFSEILSAFSVSGYSLDLISGRGWLVTRYQHMSQRNPTLTIGNATNSVVLTFFIGDNAIIDVLRHGQFEFVSSYLYLENIRFTARIGGKEIPMKGITVDGNPPSVTLIP